MFMVASVQMALYHVTMLTHAQETLFGLGSVPLSREAVHRQSMLEILGVQLDQYAGGPSMYLRIEVADDAVMLSGGEAQKEISTNWLKFYTAR